MRERAALVALLHRAGSSWAGVSADVQDAGSATAVLRAHTGQDQILFAGTEVFAGADVFTQLIDEASTQIATWESDGTRLHTILDDSYPAQLRDIREMPPILFTRGLLQPDPRAIAVVGTRDASTRGLRIATDVAGNLVRRDVTVVSGLAAGIDAAAHSAALAAGGRTVAVIGTGVRQYYPAANRALQDRIAATGLLISQFWPDAAPTRSSFPMRNAVMSGYAAATVVIEAGEHSGARIQARLALQHGRPVVLTDQVMANDWAKAFAERPGVFVVRGMSELMDVVDEILRRLPTDDLESFPDLAKL